MTNPTTDSGSRDYNTLDALTEQLLDALARKAEIDGVAINSFTGPSGIDGIDLPVPFIVSAVLADRTAMVKRYLEIGADANYRMPGENDAPGQPYTGLSLIEYAQQYGVKAETLQVLSAWQAQQTIQRVTAQGKQADERVAP